MIIAIVLSGIGLRWLVHGKERGRATLIYPELFRSRVFRLGITGQMSQQIALGGLMIALPIYLQMVPERRANCGLTTPPTWSSTPRCGPVGSTSTSALVADEPASEIVTSHSDVDV